MENRIDQAGANPAGTRRSDITPREIYLGHISGYT